jgi:hypothetical protein
MADNPCSRHGDLRSTVVDDSSILHRIAIPMDSRPGTPFLLKEKLDLGVGGAGVIGRRVSLLNGQVVAAEGVLGWN